MSNWTKLGNELEILEKLGAYITYSGGWSMGAYHVFLHDDEISGTVRPDNAISNKPQLKAFIEKHKKIYTQKQEELKKFRKEKLCKILNTKLKKGKNVFMFDVESDGLHGDAFAVACVVMDAEGIIIDEIKVVVSNYKPKDKWVKENVKINTKKAVMVSSKKELREQFYKFYMQYKENSVTLVDCGFPVETNFLSEVAKDDIKNRNFDMPYPLYDIATVLDVDISRKQFSGLIIKGSEHDPLVDCYYSIESIMKILGIKTSLIHDLKKYNGHIL